MRVRYVCLMMISYGVYLIIGASVFQTLEYAREERMCKETIEDLKKFNLSRKHRRMDALNLDSLKDFVKVILSASSNGVQFDSFLNPSCAHNWNFENSFFFAGTVVTTIGYGNIAPQTNEGRTFCIFYAVVGLPLFGIMFREIGSIFAGFFNHLEKKLRKKVSNARLRQGCVLFALLNTLAVFFIFIPSYIFVVVEQWSYGDSIYYSIISLTTIGFGDFVAGINPDLTYKNLYRVSVYFWILFGLAFMAAMINVASEMIEGSAKERSEPESIECESRSDRTCECVEPNAAKTISNPSFTVVAEEDD